MQKLAITNRNSTSAVSSFVSMTFDDSRIELQSSPSLQTSKSLIQSHEKSTNLLDFLAPEDMQISQLLLSSSKQIPLVQEAWRKNLPKSKSTA
jgi:hypothetical protein